MQQIIPDIDVVCSRDIGRVGFLERENAAILNGSILKFARKTISGFQDAINGLGLHCPLFLTQNDGTVMDIDAAAVAPIKTFSSGATVSFIRSLLSVSVVTLTDRAMVELADWGCFSCQPAKHTFTGRF